MFGFWAKSRGDLQPHSVPHHCLDVAAAACALLAIYPPPVELPVATICALIALHDIGKFSKTFQAQVPELWPARLGQFTEATSGYPHDQARLLLPAGPLAEQAQ